MISTLSFTDIVAVWGATVASVLMIKEIYVFFNKGAKPYLQIQKRRNNNGSINVIVTNRGDQPCSILAIEIHYIQRRLINRARILRIARFDSSTPFSPVRTLNSGEVLKWPFKLFDEFQISDHAQDAIDVLLFYDRSRFPARQRWQKSDT